MVPSGFSRYTVQGFKSPIVFQGRWNSTSQAVEGQKARCQVMYQGFGPTLLGHWGHWIKEGGLDAIFLSAWDSVRRRQAKSKGQKFCFSSGHKLDLHHEWPLINEMDCTDQKDKVQIPQSPDLTFKVKFVDKEPLHCWARDDGSCQGLHAADGPCAFTHVYKASCLLKSSQVSASVPPPVWTNAVWIPGSPETQWDGRNCIWMITPYALSPT